MKVTGNENVKIVFRAHLQKWIDLRQTKTKMIIGSFYTCHRKGTIHFAYRFML